MSRMVYRQDGVSGGTSLGVRSRQELLALVAEALNEAGVTYEALPFVESTKETDLRAMPTDGTVMQPIVEALNKAGVQTAATVGSVMDALQLSHDDIHALACSCHGDRISSRDAAHRIRAMNNRPI